MQSHSIIAALIIIVVILLIYIVTKKISPVYIMQTPATDSTPAKSMPVIYSLEPGVSYITGLVNPADDNNTKDINYLGTFTNESTARQAAASGGFYAYTWISATSGDYAGMAYGLNAPGTRTVDPSANSGYVSI